MSRNQKLTPIIKGRTIAQIGWDGPTALLTFDDGSTLRIHTAGAPRGDAPAAKLGRVRAVRQSNDSIAFDLDDDSSVQFSLAEATSCVMLRDAKGTLQYAD
jgi:hypothetical protein